MVRALIPTLLIRVLCIVLFASIAGGGSPLIAQESSDAAKIQFSAAAELQNDDLFDLAIGEWKTFLEKHPDDPLAVKARHFLGVCLNQEKKYEEAVAELGKVAAEHPKFEMLAATLINLATAQYQLATAANDPKLYTESAATYGKLLSQFPNDSLASTAQYNLAECYYALHETQKAIDAYQTFLKQYPDDKLKPDAYYALGITQLEADKPVEALVTLDQFLQLYPDHKLSAQARMYKADALFDQEKFGDAEKQYAALAVTEGFAFADRCLMRQADCATSQKKYGESAAIYADVAKRFPMSQYLPAATLSAGSRYHLAGDHQQAIEWLGRASGPQEAEAAHWLARAHLELKKPAPALEAVEKVLPKAEKSEFYVDLLLDQADALYEITSRRKEAIAVYAKVVDQFPDHAKAPTALYYAGWTAFNLGEHDLAKQYTKRFLDAFPDHELRTAVESVAADSYLNTGELARAEKQYGALLQRNPQHEDARRWRLLLSWSMFRQKKYEPTIAVLESKIDDFEQPGRRAEACLVLGNCHFALKQFEQARDALQKCVATEPQGDVSEEALLLLSRAQHQLNDLAAAQKTARQLIQDFPSSKILDRALYRLGEYLYNSGEFKLAAAQYQKVVDDFPNSPLLPTALYWLGASQIAEQDYPSADTTMTRLIDQHGENPLAASGRYMRAQARRLSGKPADAVADVLAFLETKPDQADRSGALFERGLAEMDLKDYPAAIASFQAILKDDPKYEGIDKVEYQLAWSLKNANRDQEASAMFGQLAQQRPDSPFAAEASYHVGEQKYADQQYKPAVESYQAALRQATAGQQLDIAEMALHKLAWSQYRLGTFGEAQQSFDKQLQQYPEGNLARDARFMSAECLFEQEQFQKALDAYQAVRKDPPPSQDFQLLALLHAGQSANQLKDWPNGVTLLEESLDVFPDSVREPDILYEIAWAKQNLKSLDEAMELYQRVTDMTQREVGARARLMMGEIKFEQGQHKEAIVNFFKVFRGYKGAPASYDPWKSQAMYETARCFEVLKNVPNAKKYYQQLLKDYPESQLAKLAQQRVSELK
ncbi:MAG: tetratricopeptide repeat protein [Pirellulales bacterium]